MYLQLVLIIAGIFLVVLPATGILLALLANYFKAAPAPNKPAPPRP